MEKNEINSLKMMTSSPWWRVMQKEMDEQIEKLTNRLLNETDNEVKFTEHDLNRRMLKLWQEIKITPETLFSSFI